MFHRSYIIINDLMEIMSPEEIETKKESINFFMLLLGGVTVITLITLTGAATFFLYWLFQLIYST